VEALGAEKEEEWRREEDAEDDAAGAETKSSSSQIDFVVLIPLEWDVVIGVDEGEQQKGLQTGSVDEKF
jgi:hypothetical protein